MRSFDLSPLFRSTVGFDHLARLLDTASRVDEQTFAYPPYNIEKLDDDHYRITMAVAGFSEDEIEVTSQDHSLVVTGRSGKEESNAQYLHRGIAARAFERRFQLAEHIRVDSASLTNGLLNVELVREVPEALRPRTIRIEARTPATQPKAVESPKTIESQAA